MYSVKIETGFNASHQLRLAGGEREPLHEHNWRVEVSVGGEQLDGIGLVVDFHWLKGQAQSIIKPFEGKKLSDLEYFRQNNPSAEAVAKYIYDKLKGSLGGRVHLESVSVEEEAGCTAKYAQ